MDALEARRGGGFAGNPLARRISAVGRETYNKGLGKQQGTTRVIYDTIDMYAGSSAGITTFDFFNSLNNKAYPFTNINRNSFTDAEAMTVQRAYLSYIYASAGTVSYSTTTQITSVMGLDEAVSFLGSVVGNSKNYFTAAGVVGGLQVAEGSLLISGQEVLKKFNFLSAHAPFNHRANWGTASESYTVAASAATYNTAQVNRSQQVYSFDSAPVIPPNREFRFPVNVGAYTLPTGSTALNYGQHYLRLTLEGFGAIPSVEGTL